MPPAPAVPVALPAPVAVLGLGCVGSSIARALQAARIPVLGWDTNPATRQAAQADGLRTAASAADASGVAALIVVAAPPDDCAAVVSQALLDAPDAWVTDVASVKAPIIHAVQASTAAWERYVPAHPMAGGTGSGWAAGQADFAQGATWVTCPQPEVTDMEGVLAVMALAHACGASTLALTADAHDAAVARASHLTQMIATSLATVSDAQVPLAALAPRSWQDQTRLAASSPALWDAILRANRSHALDALAAMEQQLGALRAALDANDTEALLSMLDAGRRARAHSTPWLSAPWMYWRGPARIDTLLRLGARGQRLRAPARAGDDLVARIQNISA